MKAFFITFLVLFFSIPSTTFADTTETCNCLEADSTEVAIFFELLATPELRENPFWSTMPVERWERVHLTEDNCNIKSIASYHNDLAGELPNLDLSKLKFLNLSTNQLEGSIPNFKLPSLVALSMVKNNFTGPMPTFSNSLMLETIQLYNNQLDAPEEPFQLPQLKKLQIDSNRMAGNLAHFTQLPSLETLHVGGSQIAGMLPDFDLPNLEELVIKATNEPIQIPNFSKLPLLKKLIFNKTNIEGSIPNFNQLPNMETLNFIDIPSPITIPSFDAATNLNQLAFYQCQLIGTIPENINLPKLENLLLFKGNLTGSIPNFQFLPSLESLTISNQQISGEIPDFQYLTKLRSLFLSDNQLTGTIPPTFETSHDLVTLRLSNNQLSGSIPAMDSLRFLTIDHNHFTFEGIEALLQTPNNQLNEERFSYAPQGEIPINRFENALAVEAGGTPSNNTYEWYDTSDWSTPVWRVTGNETFSPPYEGTYVCRITNAVCTKLGVENQNLVLQSEAFPFIFSSTNLNNLLSNQLSIEQDFSTNQINIELSTNSAIKVQMVDLLGRTISSPQALQKGRNNLLIPSVLQAGVYLLQFTDNKEQSYTHKVIIN